MALKGKRSRRGCSSSSSKSSEEEHLALCLLYMSRGGPSRRCSSLSAPPPPPPPPPPVLPYKCSVCGRAFASYQALGGHRASHRRPPLPGRRAAAPSSSLPVPFAAPGGGRGHQCLVCLKVFASGQALGGHKRCHYDGSGAVLVSSSPSSSGSGRRGFDLNLPAAEEEEEILSPLAMKKARVLFPA